ncbi:hypothetical protein FSARC_9570 [Fusarium sarcochroum]|uniref:Uncharacterized protein n=1 Tax=Fusarium sarcochroum TaxID=1208366 RepID=A0A8H4TQW0_9HYPO|nr:hypothetical protein FSARC_9570 [Fusarium sarcochroum]
MEMRDYPDRDSASPPANWEPASPSVARKPVGSKQTSPYTSPDFDFSTSTFSQRAAQQPHLQRQSTTATTDTAYYGSATPLGIWEPIPHTPGTGPQHRPQNFREDSSASLLMRDGAPKNSPETPPGPPGPPGTATGDALGPPPPPKKHNKLVTWWVNEWRPSWSMYVLVFCGVAFAIGHHFYYRGLHGQLAKDQQGKFRYGALMAFLSKACFLNAVVLAFRQRVLMEIRRKMLTLSTLDSLFAASEDLTALLNWEAWVNAKFAMAMTIFIWTSPLIVIFTSYTLTIAPSTTEEHAMCQGIRTLNFTHERTIYFRDPVQINGYYEAGSSLWNTTRAGGGDLDEDNTDEFDYYTAPSQQYETIALKTLYARKTIMREKSSTEICGQGWNCSYAIEFVAPGYKCEDLASGVKADVKKLGDAECPFNTSTLAPEGNHTYYAMLTRGDYENPQIITEPGGKPQMKAPYPKNLGVFRTEPIMWFGYSDVKDRTKEQPALPGEGDWDKAYTPKIFGCEHYKVKYKVRVNLTGEVQTHNVTHREYLEKVIDTTWIPKKDPDKKLKDRTQATPEKNYVFPHDRENYRETAAYHSIGSVLRNVLNGTTELPYHNVNSEIIRTRLLDSLNYLPVKNFSQEMQNVYEEILMSFFSNPQMAAVSWAANASDPTGNRKGDSKTEYPCVRRQLRNCFLYNYAQLWAVYAVSMCITLVAVASGVTAMEENAMMRSTSFTAILAASRATSLDKLRWEKEADLKGTKIGFGLVSDRGERTYSFGVEGDVSQEKAMATGRSPGISMMNWGDKTARRMSYAVLNRRGGQGNQENPDNSA